MKPPVRLVRMASARRRAGCCALMAILALAPGFWPKSAAATQRHAEAAKAPFAPQFAIADFDGDEKPDLASVQPGAGSNPNALYLIDFRLSSGSRRTYGLTASAGGVRLASRDVNGDHLLDIVVTSTLTGEPLAVFLNDGQGNFTRSAPEAYPEAYRDQGTFLTADGGANEDRSGAETSRPGPTNGESVGRFGTRDSRPLRIATNFYSANDPGQMAWRGRAPPVSPVSR